MATPAAKPDPCATDLPTLRTAMAMHVQGYDNISSATAATLTCLSDVKTGTDVIVIRRVSTCVAGSSGCDAFAAGTPYMQASLCSSASELDSASYVDYFAMDTAASGLTKHKKDCLTTADYHRFLTRIYFVANNDVSGDAIPTLKRAELVGTSFTIVPLVEGVENLQLEWGLDTSATPDGAPDVFNANPDTYTGAGAVGATGNWRNVVSARVNVLARNTQSTVGYTDVKTYSLGYNADGSANTYTPTGSDAAFRRHAYVAEVRLNNAAQRGVTP
jgi:type IV pilus assembly protein PilW